MPGSLSAGIVLPANLKGGPQKVSAVAALDLARGGHKVTIFIPVLPYYYYSMSLKTSPNSWLRAVRPHVMEWVRGRKFCFQELLDQEGVSGRVSVRFVPRRASRRQLQGLGCLIFHSIAQVVEYQNRFPQDRQIYVIHHPEERAHGHADTFKRIRQSFKGKILVISPFTAREVGDHILNPQVLPNSISPMAWAQRHAFDPQASRKDILFFWKDRQGGSEGSEIIRALLEVRPRATVTIWCRGRGVRAGAQGALPGVQIVENLSEKGLCDLYLGHSLLLFPSSYEGFGMPPIEALACGCIPILRPDVGAAELYARDGGNSIYLNGQPGEVAHRIATILDSPDVLRAMRVAAPKSIDPFNPNGYGQRLLEAAGFL